MVLGYLFFFFSLVGYLCVAKYVYACMCGYTHVCVDIWMDGCVCMYVYLIFSFTPFLSTSLPPPRFPSAFLHTVSHISFTMKREPHDSTRTNNIAKTS